MSESDQEQRFREAVGDVVPALEPRLHVREERAVEVENVLMQPLRSRSHPIRQVLEDWEEVDQVRNRSRAVPVGSPRINTVRTTHGPV